jgi:hypothetical protein
MYDIVEDDIIASPEQDAQTSVDVIDFGHFF